MRDNRRKIRSANLIYEFYIGFFNIIGIFIAGISAIILTLGYASLWIDKPLIALLGTILLLATLNGFLRAKSKLWGRA